MDENPDDLFGLNEILVAGSLWPPRKGKSVVRGRAIEDDFQFAEEEPFPARRDIPPGQVPYKEAELASARSRKPGC
jgi:hypothetical protein